ncbi:uncharacterized protein PHACADRAFT_262706 [Phanerochaete carnosa HHB-10118-sp]|uniref:Uncharacterized protein n=1 Tax=Phanerochaete carnosa (strain HHB-10118-sp) TaxID=650164 RepID=K5VZC7_PHACS|nr:uncharacterized protein PHACADRAFT_262706 [Phanerochaete carnosa HHB-10118-sp]EKM52195.1 hypothetical protein PHACADRAFT_262706 [Phanerochaete carnosa HHB-10118-sp]
MSSAVTSVSGYGSPASPISPVPHVSAVPRVSPAPSAYVHHSISKANRPKLKPINVFSNDGTFLECFQHMGRDEGQKKRQEEIFARKREFDNRFRTRGKRSLPPVENSNDAADTPSKKRRTDNHSPKRAQ